MESKSADSWEDLLAAPRPIEDGEKRRFPRIPEPPLHMNGIWGTVLDVSLGGCCIAASEKLRPGARYELIALDTFQYSNHDLRAEVIWCAEGRVGLRWVDLSPEQEEWLRSRIDVWLGEPQLVQLHHA